MKTIREATQIWTAFSKEVMPIEPEMNDIEVSNLVGSIYCPGPWYSYVFAINEARFISMHQNARQFYGKENNEVTIDDLIDRIDIDGNGTIDYTEFVMATMNEKNILSNDKLEQAFKMFDKVR